jgi:hypothetical protein
MLASFPASILNQIPPESGNPLDSIKKQHALGGAKPTGPARRARQPAGFRRASVWGPGTFVAGFVSAALVVPIFLYRHYIVDRGVFPKHMYQDLVLAGETELGPTRAGGLPYVALAGGVASCLAGYLIFWG